MTAMRISSGVLLVALAAGCAGRAAPRVDPLPGKRAEARNGMVSASHPDAAAAGLAMLRRGGNAVDAAVATAFALSVVDPSQTGLGGGGSATLWFRSARRAESVDFMAASGADSLWSTTGGTSASGQRNGRAAAVPGTVAGLLHLLERHGTVPRADVIEPAIRLARDGFVVSPLLSRTIASSLEKLRADTAAFARFAPNGTPLQPGDRLVQPELAATLERIAREGAAAFYAGAVASNLSARVRAAGGLITEADLRDFRVLTRRPVCSRFAGHTVLSAPPPLSGMSIAESLAILEATLPADSLGATLAESPRAALVLADALRIADVDRTRWRGDPAAMSVPARGISSAAYAAERAPLVGTRSDTLAAGDPWAEDAGEVPAECAALEPYPAAARAAAADAPGGAADDAGASNTSHLSVVDGQRNAVSMTFTVGVLFGSGVYTDGFFLNSAGANFDRRTAGPNRRNNSTDFQ